MRKNGFLSNQTMLRSLAPGHLKTVFSVKPFFSSWLNQNRAFRPKHIPAGIAPHQIRFFTAGRLSAR